MSQNSSDRETFENDFVQDNMDDDIDSKHEITAKNDEGSTCEDDSQGQIKVTEEWEDINNKIQKDLKKYKSESKMCQDSDKEDEHSGGEDEHTIVIDREELETLRSYRNICLNIRDNLEQIKSSKKVEYLLQ